MNEVSVNNLGVDFENHTHPYHQCQNGRVCGWLWQSVCQRDQWFHQCPRSASACRPAFWMKWVKGPETVGVQYQYRKVSGLLSLSPEVWTFFTMTSVMSVCIELYLDLSRVFSFSIHKWGNELWSAELGTKIELCGAALSSAYLFLIPNTSSPLPLLFYSFLFPCPHLPILKPVDRGHQLKTSTDVLNWMEWLLFIVNSFCRNGCSGITMFTVPILIPAQCSIFWFYFLN